MELVTEDGSSCVAHDTILARAETSLARHRFDHSGVRSPPRLHIHIWARLTRLFVGKRLDVESESLPQLGEQVVKTLVDSLESSLLTDAIGKARITADVPANILMAIAIPKIHKVYVSNSTQSNPFFQDTYER